MRKIGYNNNAVHLQWGFPLELAGFALRNCVRVARQTLTLFVWVRILVPQPEKPVLNVAQNRLFLLFGL